MNNLYRRSGRHFETARQVFAAPDHFAPGMNFGTSGGVFKDAQGHILPVIPCSEDGGSWNNRCLAKKLGQKRHEFTSWHARFTNLLLFPDTWGVSSIGFMGASSGYADPAL